MKKIFTLALVVTCGVALSVDPAEKTALEKLSAVKNFTENLVDPLVDQLQEKDLKTEIFNEIEMSKEGDCYTYKKLSYDLTTDVRHHGNFSFLSIFPDFQSAGYLQFIVAIQVIGSSKSNDDLKLTALYALATTVVDRNPFVLNFLKKTGIEEKILTATLK